MPTILFLSLLTILVSADFRPAEAQKPPKVPPIGFLTGSSLSSQLARNEAFRQSLRELGYVEEKIFRLSGALTRGI